MELGEGASDERDFDQAEKEFPRMSGVLGDSRRPFINPTTRQEERPFPRSPAAYKPVTKRGCSQGWSLIGKPRRQRNEAFSGSTRESKETWKLGEGRTVAVEDGRGRVRCLGKEQETSLYISDAELGA
eukprot:5639298-Heterocapsa_arctica.AAC.1